MQQVRTIAKHLLPVLKCLEGEADTTEIQEHMEVLFEWPPTTMDELKDRLPSLFLWKIEYPLSNWFVHLLNTPTEHRAYRRSLLSIEDPMTRELLLSALSITLK